MSARTRVAAAGRSLRRMDTRLVVTAAIIAVLAGAYSLVIALAQRQYSQELPIASVNSSSPEGLQSLYLYLGELGVDARSLEQFDPLPEKGTIVIASDTFLIKSPTEADAERLSRWVEDGGRVVLAGPVAIEAFAGDLAGGVGTVPVDPASDVPATPTIYASGVKSASFGPVELTGVGGDWVTIAGKRGDYAATRRFGEGEVIVLASTYPLTNEGLGEKNNARLATLLTAGGTRPLFFDEYHQGYARGGSMWDRLNPGGRIGVLFALAAVAIVLVARSRRLGPPIPQPQVATARTGAYIGQLAEVYRSAGARAHALSVLEDALVRSLRRRHGMLSVGLARNTEAAAALDRSERVRTAGKVKEEEFIETARALIRARRDVEERHG